MTGMNRVIPQEVWEREKAALAERNLKHKIAVLEGTAPLTWGLYVYMALLDTYGAAKSEWGGMRDRFLDQTEGLRSIVAGEVARGKQTFPAYGAG